MSPDHVILIVGPRGSGKTTLLLDLLKRQGKTYQRGYAVTPDPKEREHLERYLPPECISGEYDGNELQDIMDTASRPAACDEKGRACVILSESLREPEVMRSSTIRNLFMNSRHYGLTVIFVMSYPDLPVELRGNVDCVFALDAATRLGKRRLWDKFFGMVPTFDDFCAMHDAFTADHGALVIQQHAASQRIEDAVFWYRAATADGSLETSAPYGGHTPPSAHPVTPVVPMHAHRGSAIEPVEIFSDEPEGYESENDPEGDESGDDSEGDLSDDVDSDTDDVMPDRVMTISGLESITLRFRKTGSGGRIRLGH